MSQPTIVIVGRPNVGKSTLFNRLAGYRKAIVDDEPGITRDRNFARFHWRGLDYLLIDTGGLEPEAREGLGLQVRRQIQVAMQEADLILFLVSAREGLTPLDLEIGRMLRRGVSKPIFLVINKVDAERWERESTEFLQLGFARHFLVSAEQGRGIGELLDAIGEALPRPAGEEVEEGMIRVAILGRPNVGKSSLLNRLLGEERVIVSAEPGTTRDAVDTPFRYGPRSYLLIDTAGIRRAGKIEEPYERYAVIRALKSLERADLALIVLDATSGVTAQDCRIASLAEEKGCSCLLLVNKWDLVPSSRGQEQDFGLAIRQQLRYLDYAPLLFVSALTGAGVEKVFPEVERVAQEREKRVTTSSLNRVLQEATASHQPPSWRGQPARIFYATQLGQPPPTFLIFTDRPEAIHPSYRRYLVHKLRDAFEFRGSPIRLAFRRRE